MIDVVFSHKDFLIINKPAGMSFHSEQGAGVIAQLQQQLQTQLDKKSDINGSEVDLYAVHRLDKMTSGLLIVALNKKAAQIFQKLFAEQKIDKLYLSIAGHKPKKKQGWIKGDMQAARRGSWKLTNSLQNPAVTRFKSFALRTGERLYVLKPLTGRTHQLRVALKSLAVPIFGDLRYANKDDAVNEERGYLHACALKFDYLGEQFSFEKIPDFGERFLSNEFKDLLQSYPDRWALFD